MSAKRQYGEELLTRPQSDLKAGTGLQGNLVTARSAPQVARDVDYRDRTLEVVKDLMRRRSLTKREELLKRSVVTDVLNGVMDVFKSVSFMAMPKVARPALIISAGQNRSQCTSAESLRGVTQIVNLNKAIPQGFNTAIDQNSQIQVRHLRCGTPSTGPALTPAV